jgi:hypothetical protein
MWQSRRTPTRSAAENAWIDAPDDVTETEIRAALVKAVGAANVVLVQFDMSNPFVKKDREG